jgi:membrane protease YdiL (CAAX protease family)
MNNHPFTIKMNSYRETCAPHPLGKSLALHLVPGALLTIVFLFIASAVNRICGSSYLALLVCIPLVLVPVEAGVLIFERRRLGCSWRSLIAGHRGPPLSFLEGLATVVLLYAVSVAVGTLGSFASGPILCMAKHLLPAWAIVKEIPAGIKPATLWLGLALSGLVAPVVEELYFRGFLMPRIPVAEFWAPTVNAALFSIYHFFAPWNYAIIFAAFLPLAYYVRRRGNLVPAVIVHCLFNSVGIILALAKLT